MGLDILHCIAKSERSGDFCRVEGFSDEMKLRESYFQEYDNPHLDWERMFSARGLAYQDYFLRTRSTDGVRNTFGFVDAASASVNAPIRILFSDRNALFRLLPTFMLPHELAFKGARRFFGPLATVMKRETVIFYDTAGYLRNSVSDAFFQAFRPNDLACTRRHAEWICEQTAPEVRDDFKRGFLDNWDDDHSFILISY